MYKVQGISIRDVAPFVVCLLLVLLKGSVAEVWAQETLSIGQCRELALRNNKEKQSAALSTQAARFTMKSTRAMFFPNLSLVGLGIYDSGDGSQSIQGGLLPVGSVATGSFVPAAGNVAYFPGLELDYKVGGIYSGGLMLKQPLYMGGKIRAGYQMSRLAVSLYEQGERMTEAQVLQRADEAYAKVVHAQELLLVADKYHALLEELDKNGESAVRHGLRMENDRLKVQVKLSEVELQQRRAQNGIRLATMNLCHVIGLPLNTEVKVSSEYPSVDEALTLQTGDVSARPEFAMLDYQTQIANQQVKAVRSEMLPQLALLAKYGYTHGIEFNNRTLLDGWNFAGGVTLSIPLYHFGEYTNKLKAAKTKLQQSQTDMANKKELMLLELAKAANGVDESRLEVSLAEKTRQQAEESMKLSGKQYEAGVEPLSDYLEAQALWQKACEAEVGAHFQLYLSSVEYLRAAGR